MSKLDDIAYKLRFAQRTRIAAVTDVDQAAAQSDYNRIQLSLMDEALRPQSDAEIIRLVKQSMESIPKDTRLALYPQYAHAIFDNVERLIEIIEAHGLAKEPPMFMGLEPSVSITTHTHRCTAVHQPSVSQCIRTQQTVHGSKSNRHQAWTSQGHFVEWAA